MRKSATGYVTYDIYFLSQDDDGNVRLDYRSGLVLRGRVALYTSRKAIADLVRAQLHQGQILALTALYTHKGELVRGDKIELRLPAGLAEAE